MSVTCPGSFVPISSPGSQYFRVKALSAKQPFICSAGPYLVHQMLQTTQKLLSGHLRSSSSGTTQAGQPEAFAAPPSHFSEERSGRRWQMQPTMRPMMEKIGQVSTLLQSLFCCISLRNVHPLHNLSPKVLSGQELSSQIH